MEPTRLQRLSYGLPGLPLAVLGLPLVVYLPALYTQELGLSLFAVGSALLLARLFDVVSDVAIGALSDRAHAWGLRRKHAIAAGVPLLLIGIDQLFAPPGDVSFITLLLWCLITYLGWTLIAVPYYAWGAELSTDAHTRTRLAGSREAFTLFGVAAVIFLPTLLNIADEPATVMRGVAQSLWFVLPVAVLAALWLVPERPTVAAAPQAAASLFAPLRANRPLRRLLSAYTLSGVANALPATLFIFFVTHVLAAEAHIGLFLGLYFLAGILALPGWIALARRVGRQRAWAGSMLLAVLAFAAAPWLGPGDLWLYGAICLVTGISYGADLALPASLQADMVDIDRHYAGRRRAGLLFGLWGLATKLAAAVGVALAFGLLGLAGFDPQADNDAATLGLLALLYGLAPILLKLIAIALVWRLPEHLAAVPALAERSEEDMHHVDTHSDPAVRRWPARRLHDHAT